MGEGRAENKEVDSRQGATARFQSVNLATPSLKQGSVGKLKIVSVREEKKKRKLASESRAQIESTCIKNKKKLSITHLNRNLSGF